MRDKDGIRIQRADMHVVQIGHLFVVDHHLIILVVAAEVLEVVEESDKDSVIRVDPVPVILVIVVILTHVGTQVQVAVEILGIVVVQEEHGEFRQEVVPELRLRKRVQVSIKDYRLILSRAESVIYN